MKTKTFDCVEMKRQGALKIYEIIKNMTIAEEIEYWHKRSEKFRGEHKALIKKSLNKEERIKEGGL